MSSKVKLVSSTKIYLDANALLDHILDITPSFPRQYKYSIGTKMHELAVELIQLLSCYYLVTVEAQENEIIYELFNRPTEK